MLYKDNPFRVLEVSLLDDRRKIVRSAEEKELFIDQQKFMNARTILTNPQRRIAAEVHWFLDCSDNEVKEIEGYIASRLEGADGDDLLWENYCALTQLNIQMACIGAQDFQNIPSAKYYILGISRLFEAIDTERVLQMINECRSEAGYPEIQTAREIETAMVEMRTEIRQTLTRHLQKIPKDSYTQIVTLLSESYSGNQRYKGQAVLEDVISEYQIYIDDPLHQLGQNITKTAKFILMGATKIDVNKAVSDLIEKLYAWDKMAQPLQLGALTKGSSHEESREMLLALRELAVKLHNDYEMSNESLEITKATQEVFKELPEFADLLDNDNKTLTRLIEEEQRENPPEPELTKEQEAVEKIHQGLQQLEKSMQEVKDTPQVNRKEKITTLVSQMKALDKLVKSGIEHQILGNQTRERIAYMVRSLGIELYNNYKDLANALQVIMAVKKEFSDMPEIGSAIDHDIRSLSMPIISSLAETKKEREKKRGKIGTIIACCVVGLGLLAFIVFGVGHAISDKQSRSVPQNTVSPTTTISSAPPAATSKPTAKPTTKPTNTPKPTAKPTPKPSPTPQPKEMPKNGYVFYCSTTDRPSSFKVTNNSSSNYYMKFVKAGTNSSIIKFFVRANSTVEIDMPAGNLELRYAYGDTWYGESLLFGDKTRYAKDSEYYDFSNYSWEITFRATSITPGESMDVEAIDADEF